MVYKEIVWVLFCLEKRAMIERCLKSMAPLKQRGLSLSHTPIQTPFMSN